MSHFERVRSSFLSRNLFCYYLTDYAVSDSWTILNTVLFKCHIFTNLRRRVLLLFNPKSFYRILFCFSTAQLRSVDAGWRFSWVCKADAVGVLSKVSTTKCSCIEGSVIVSCWLSFVVLLLKKCKINILVFLWFKICIFTNYSWSIHFQADTSWKPHVLAEGNDRYRLKVTIYF